MAEWKKVIVSGSNISELVNDANYLVDAQDSAILSGSFSGSFEGDGSGLTGVVAQAANALTDGNGIADFTYDGNTASVTVSVEADGGTLTVGASGVKVSDSGIDTDQLAADAVNGDKIADDAVDSEHIAAGAIDFEHFSAGSVSGSVVADASLPNAKLVNDSVTVGSTEIDLGVSATTIAGLTSVTSTTFVGDLTGTADSASIAAAVAPDSVALGTDTTGNYVQSVANATNGGVTVTNGAAEGGAATLALNLNDLSAAVVNVGADSIAIIDADGDGTKKESIVDLVAGIAGTNLTAGSGQLSLASSISGNHTFSNNVTVSGNLTVEGSQINANVANLDVEDRFILLNSGSSTVGDSGIIFGGSVGNLNSGSALVWDASYNSDDGRLGVVAEMGSTDSGDQTIAYHIAGVYEGNATDAATAQADHVGNIRVESSEIYIYV